MRGSMIAAALVALTLAFSGMAFAGEKTVELKIDGMSCGMCPPAAEKALKGVKGVKAAEVTLEGGKAVVTCDEAVKAEDLVKAVQAAGHGFAAQVVSTQ